MRVFPNRECVLLLAKTKDLTVKSHISLLENTQRE